MDHEDRTKIPEVFPEIGGRDFSWVWKNKKEFCEGVREMKECTEFFLVFQNYCLRKQVNDGGVPEAE